MITNRSATPVNGWALTWTFPDAGRRVPSVANGAHTQTGPAVRIVNLPWNGYLAPTYGTVSLVVQLSFGTVNPVPVDFAPNGQGCAAV